MPLSKVIPNTQTNKNTMLLTALLGSHHFAFPVLQIKDVITGVSITPIPRAPDDIAGFINLRGRIVTVINLGKKLNQETNSCPIRPILLVVKHALESYSLLVDVVGEVITVPNTEIEMLPANLPPLWQEIASGIYRAETGLMTIINVEALITNDTQIEPIID